MARARASRCRQCVEGGRPPCSASFCPHALSVYPHAGGNGRVIGLSNAVSGSSNKGAVAGGSVSNLDDHPQRAASQHICYFCHTRCVFMLAVHQDSVSQSLPSSEKCSGVTLRQTLLLRSAVLSYIGHTPSHHVHLKEGGTGRTQGNRASIEE